jgi:hypothetical protein
MARIARVARDVPADAVRKLLSEALDRGVGVAFEPLQDGWRISYLTPYRLPELEEYELRGGPLADAGDLEAAAAAALTPLREIVEEIEEFGESEA